MAENELIVTAGLNFQASESLILAQLKKIQDDFNSNGGLQINCAVNNDSLKAIQSQLSSLKQTLNVDVNASYIQQSINQATKVEPVKINVTAEVNKGELQRQAKEIEKTLGIVYPKGQTEALRTELKGLLSEYQKVFDASGYSKEAENQMSKILQFALSYKREEQLVNEELKHQQERIKEIQREQQKVFITAEQYVALQKEAEAQGTNAKVMLDRLLGGSTGWTNDINKVSNPNKPYYWSNFAKEVNSINPLKDAIVNEGDIVQGVRDLADIFSKSFTQIDDSIEKNKAELNNWAIFLMETVGKVTGRSPFADSVWIDFGTDEIKQTEQNVQALAKGMQTIAALKESIKSSDPNGVQSVTADWTQDAERNLNGFVLNVHKATGEVERLHYALDETGESFERIQITGSDSGVERMLVKATKSADSLERKMLNLKAAADDVSAPRPITSDESINKVSQAYNNASEAVQKLRTADASTFGELENQAKIAVDNLNNVIKAARNADTAATKLRAKPIETIKVEELSNLDKFTATISGSAIPNVENLIQKVETLREFLGKVNDKQGLTDYLNRLTEVTADFKALEGQAKAVNKALSDLDKLSANTQFARNAQNPDVTSQLANIDALKAKYQQLFANIGNAKAPEDLQRISESLSQLKPEFDAVTQSSNELSNSLKNNSSAEKLESDIRNLTNRVETFANTNKRATESLKLMRNGVTFADEWKRITEQLKSGNLDDNAIRRLSNDLRNFQAEARNANLTTSKFFTDMGSQLKMLVTRWFSLYAVIGRVTSALNDLKEVDKILTEIAKSSDVTRESLEELGNAAFETANQYGRAAADYLYGVQEFSRAGFRGDQLTGLTEVSLLAQSAGDIETDLANSYVIATNAAYGYKGSVEELTEVLDRQNYVTNNYALNMTDLANATKIAASQAAQSGVEIDEMTAALATMISSTQQGGEIASRALRGILMNIQQVKGEVGDGEEDITAESLSKYEKAAANLGVALKEVRDGVVVLRDPMQVLNDLAVAFNKESDDSIKKAELINAVGGKYRGNQLAALLGNWDTYKDILNTFNSEQAVGSAFRETQKDVESWSGQLNILKNNWDEFINAVINSNTAINTLKGFSGVLNGLVAVSDKLGGLGTVATLISGVAGAKGSGILSAVQQYSRISKSIAGITTEDVAMLRQYNALIGQGVSVSQASAQALNGASDAARRLATNANGAAVSEEVLNRAQNKLTLGARAGAVATKALGVALNVAFNMAVVAIISAIVKGLDELIVTQKEAAQLAEEQRQKALDAMSAYEAESTALNDVVSQYTKMISSTSDLSSQKEQLLNLQNQLPDSYKEEADGIDLVNGKISDNIALLNELERKKADQYVRDNQGAYEIAQQELAQRTSYSFNAKGIKSFAGDKRVRDYLLSIEKISKDTDSWSGLSSDSFRDFTIENATLDEQVQILSQIRDFYKDLEGHNATWLDQLDDEIKRLQKIVDEDNSLIDGMKEKQKIASLTAQEYNLIKQAALAYREYQTSLNSENKDEAQNALSALYNVKDVVYSMTDSSSALRTQFDELWNTFTIGAKESVTSIEEVRADFAELSGETFDNELKNIESISKAIDSMLNDETLSHEDAWKLLNLDTEGVLSDIQLINGQYKLSTDQLVALMEQQINKQKESIETTKAAAQAEYDLLQAQLRRLKVNSPSDVAAYKLEVERITEEMRDMQDVIFGSDLLLQELNGILGKTYSITGSIATGLSNAVKQFEAEVEAVDDAIDSLNDRKEVLQDEKSILQDQLDALNEQKKTIEDTLATYDRVGEAVDELVKAQVDGIQAQIDALEEERKSIEDYYEEQLDALKEQNEERDDAIEKEEALANLANAQNQKKRVYSSDRGWDYEASKSDILKAQNELAKIANNEQIKMLENERDAKLAGYDDRKKEYETQIKEYEDYASKYTSISNDIKIAENELLAAQILGSDWREKIEQKDESLLTNYRAQYTSFNEQLNNLTNNEIATLQASIDAKDEEIKKIDDEIAAYNKYKKSVEKSLNDAKTALENYKNSMNDAKTEIINALDGVERETQDKNGKIISHNEAMAKSAEDAKDRMNHAYWEIGNSARELANTLQEHLLHGDIDLAQYVRMMHLDGYADGGVNTSTGIAMLHGTKQKGEVIFNASDSKKLYDMIHGTPNLLADAAKQANKIAGFSPVNNNNNTNSVSVSIGQIVANNPQEFTRGLDIELDKYFRRKLTESYVQ